MSLADELYPWPPTFPAPRMWRTLQNLLRGGGDADRREDAHCVWDVLGYGLFVWDGQTLPAADPPLTPAAAAELLEPYAAGSTHPASGAPFPVQILPLLPPVLVRLLGGEECN
jgi:hypothetical protein